MKYQTEIETVEEPEEPGGYTGPVARFSLYYGRTNREVETRDVPIRGALDSHLQKLLHRVFFEGMRFEAVSYADEARPRLKRMQKEAEADG